MLLVLMQFLIGIVGHSVRRLLRKYAPTTILSLAGRNEVSGIRKCIDHQPHLKHIVGSCRDLYAVLKMLHPMVLLNGRRFLSEEIRPNSAEFS